MEVQVTSHLPLSSAAQQYLLACSHPIWINPRIETSQKPEFQYAPTQGRKASVQELCSPSYNTWSHVAIQQIIWKNLLYSAIINQASCSSVTSFLPEGTGLRFNSSSLPLRLCFPEMTVLPTVPIHRATSLQIKSSLSGVWRGKFDSKRLLFVIG